MKKLALTQGKFALVDDEDFQYLNQWKWQHTTKNGHEYVFKCEYERLKNNKYIVTFIYLQRFLTNCPEGEVVYFLNKNSLDCRKKNLKIGSYSEARQNKKMRKDNLTGFKGIKYHKNTEYKKRKKNYSASIFFNRKIHHLGYFYTAIEAAKAYNIAAKKYFGRYAVLNQI